MSFHTWSVSAVWAPVCSSRSTKFKATDVMGSDVSQSNVACLMFYKYSIFKKYISEKTKKIWLFQIDAALSPGKSSSVQCLALSLTVCVASSSICVNVSMCSVNPVTAVGVQGPGVNSQCLSLCVREKGVTDDSYDNLTAMETSQDMITASSRHVGHPPKRWHHADMAAPKVTCTSSNTVFIICTFMIQISLQRKNRKPRVNKV